MTEDFSLASIPDKTVIESAVRLALAEDVGSGDATAALLPATQRFTGHILAREAGVLCGTEWANETFKQLDPEISVSWHKQDGDRLAPNDRLCEIEGNARAILTGERTALNFLQLLSGTASKTRLYVDAVAGTRTRILDTRKTIPGLRLAQKYAVLAGGGTNHRIGLYDAILIKENHISAAGSIPDAVGQSREQFPDLLLETEVETLEQLSEAVAAGVDRVLLDNFALEDLAEAVRAYGDRVDLEASGGITLDTIGEVARTGVDFISVGALTKHVRALDLSMRPDKPNTD